MSDMADFLNIANKDEPRPQGRGFAV